MQFFLYFLVSLLPLVSSSGYNIIDSDGKLPIKPIYPEYRSKEHVSRLTKPKNPGSRITKPNYLVNGIKESSSKFKKTIFAENGSKDPEFWLLESLDLEKDNKTGNASQRQLDRQLSTTSLFGTGYEYSLGALNTLFGLTGTTSTFSIGNLSYLTLGIIILIPLIIGLALIFYLVGGSGAAAAVLKRVDSELVDFATAARNNEMSFNPYAIDWEKFTILDWISVAEDTWKNFQPSNLDCQKRLICEIHQNTLRFGYVAKKLVDLFSYLEYAELLRLPEEAKGIIDDYMDAADRGRSLKKDCGEIYNNCDFSVKKIYDKVTDNEIH